MNLRVFPSVVCVATASVLVSQAAQAQTAQVPNKAPNVVEIEVQFAGPATVSKDRLLANMRTRVGQPYSEAVVEEDIRNLYSTGNVVNVRIFGEPKGDGVKVIVVLQAKAKITAVEIEGAQQFKLSRLREKISVKPGDAGSEAAMEADRQKILEYYASKGFTDVKVEYKLDVNENLGTAKVTYKIEEGTKTAVASVRFEGNQQIPSKELRKLVKTKKFVPVWSPIVKTGRVSQEQLGEDVVAIREYYQNRGYSDVQIDEPRIVKGKGKADIVFSISEGAPYRVGKITMRGGQLFPVEQLMGLTKVRSGAVYSPSAVQADIKALQDFYGSKGYVDFQAGARTTSGGDHVSDLTISIEEGGQAHVGRVNITGNTRTKDKVIRRELALAPGDMFNTVRLEASKQRLNNLNYFSKVDMYPSESGAATERDLNVVVEEKRTGSLNFGAGFSSVDSLLGFVELTQGNFDGSNWHNFTGGGQKFRTRVQYGAKRKDAIISLTEPYFLDQKLSLGGEAFYHDASYVSDYFSQQDVGFELTARKPLTEFSFARLGYRVDSMEIHSVASDAPAAALALANKQFLKSQVFGGVTYDTRDSLFLTRKGERLDISTYVSGGPVGGDIQIYGWNIEGSKYMRFKWDTILTLNAQASVVDEWGKANSAFADTQGVPLFDRLFLGGSNDLRGFRFRHVGGVGKVKEGGEPLGGKTLARATAEYTVPIIDKVRGAVFYDVGFVNGDAYDFSSSMYNADAGLGLRLDLPIGPVRIDYGVPTKKDADLGTSRGRFNFNVGYQF
jgi:outer membrane protein insertion porin family